MRAEGCGEVSFAVRECGGEFSPVLLLLQSKVGPSGRTYKVDVLKKLPRLQADGRVLKLGRI